MKKHAIIPIFISHRGCPNQCVFCNQRAITARQGDVTVKDAEEIIERWLTSLDPSKTEIEISFFGGSFTGIPMEEQNAFLSLAKKYKDEGKISKIHCSTRPDYISPEILNNLKSFGMDVIELGIQSFDEKVLAASKRGHDAGAAENACRLIKEWGFTLGIQLMIGLPEDSYDSCLYSARKTVELQPQIARLYPTVVLENTELSEMLHDGRYAPRPFHETVSITKEMYRILTNAGINVIRIGLKSNENIKGETYHPAIGQIVKSQLALEEMEKQLGFLAPKKGDLIEISASAELMSLAAGHKASNKSYLKDHYPDLRFSFMIHDDINGINLKIKEKNTKKKDRVFLSEDAGPLLEKYLESRGLEIIKVGEKNGAVFAENLKSQPISSHPDIYLCALPCGPYFAEVSKLSPKYPGDVLCNAAAVGKYIVCSKYTDPKLIERSSLTPLIVPQGYVKCNLVVLDDTHVITEDRGIAKALEGSDIRCLLVSPGEVALPGYPHGFIGGASGKVGKTIVFNGNIRAHSSYPEMKKFIDSLGLSVKDFDYPLTDIGSIIIIPDH